MATKKARILLIDDDVDFVESTRTVLESKPYEVIVAHEGNEGIAKAKKDKPDLILLDVIMPIKDGFTAAEQIKKDPALNQIPLLMLTGYAAKRAGSQIPVSRGYDLVADDYIDKPVKPEELLEKVAKYLKK